jgi:putative tryptophan/tyrosine transport system substrate-binding protein
MKRREFIAGLGSAAAWPMVAFAQQQAQPVIGCLYSGPALSPRSKEAFLQGLREQGYSDGRNVTIEYRFAEQQYDRLPALAADLVGRRVSVIVGFGLVSSLSAKKATDTIPIVFGIGADPVKSGLVTSFNKPNGNVTGVTILIQELGPKRLGLVHDLLPDAKVIGILFNPTNPNAETGLEELRTAARSIGLSLQAVGVRNAGHELETAFSNLNEQRVGALIIEPDDMLQESRARIVALAASHTIPAIYPLRYYAEAGGLISYGSDLVDGNRQQGAYAGRILNGEKLADLPVVQSVKLELVINLKAANTIGLDIPPTLLARADAVIE